MSDNNTFKRGFRFTRLFDRAKELHNTGISMSTVKKVISYNNLTRCSPPLCERDIENLVRRACVREHIPRNIV